MKGTIMKKLIPFLFVTSLFCMQEEKTAGIESVNKSFGLLLDTFEETLVFGVSPSVINKGLSDGQYLDNHLLQRAQAIVTKVPESKLKEEILAKIQRLINEKKKDLNTAQGSSAQPNEKTDPHSELETQEG